MVALKIAWQFIKSNKLQSIVIFLTVVIGVAVQFFVFSLGNVLSSMILEQATTYQDHLVISNSRDDNVSFDYLDYAFRDELVSKFPAINKALYSGTVIGSLQDEKGSALPFSLYVSEAVSENVNYLDYYGLSNSDNLVEGRVNNPLLNEIMLDDYFAKQHNINVGTTITFANTLFAQSFVVVGTFDLGIFKISRNYAYVSYNIFTQDVKIKEALKIQLHNPTTIDDFELALSEYISDDYTIDTWTANFPEMKLLDLAQKAVVLVIQILISVAIFAIILSVLSFMIQQKEKQIGILKAMGLENIDVFRIFAFMSTILSITALFFGLGGGTLAMVLYHDHMRYPNGVHRFPFKLTFSDYILSSGLAVVAVIIATFFAIKKVRKSKVIELIK